MTGPAFAALGQALAEATILTDVCSAVRVDKSGPGTFDPDTGTTTWPSTTVFTDQPCQLRMVAINERQVQAGEHEFVLQYAVLKVSVSAPLLEVGDTVTLTGAVDPLLVGKEFDVIAVHLASQISTRRYQVRMAAA